MAIATLVAEQLSTKWPFFLTTVLALVGAWLFQASKSNLKSKIPFAGAELGDERKRLNAFLTDSKTMYNKAYALIKKGTGACRLTTPRISEVIVLDTKYLVELKNLPDDVLSFSRAIDETMYPEWTNVQADRPIIPHVVQRDLTPSLGRLNPLIAEEVDESFHEEIPPTEDWTAFPVNHHLLRIIAKVSGRIFVGPELCRTEDYINMAINSTMETMTAVHAISMVPVNERKDKVRGLPEYQALRAAQAKAEGFLQPLIQARKKAMKEDPDYQKPDDIMQWMLDGGQTKYGEQSDEELTQIQIGLTFAAIHTTTMNALNALYCLAVMPELIPELREEIRGVLNEYGTFTTPALQKMKKLDSFMREVMRVHALAWSSFQRKVLKPFVLSDGTLIPEGCIIEVPAYNTMHDDDLVPNAQEFDALRCYNLRENPSLKGAAKASVDATNQIVSVTATSLTFGYGRHACPGRFFAANEIKMILGRAILEYDIKNADGTMERYPNLLVGENMIADPTKELLFRKTRV